MEFLVEDGRITYRSEQGEVLAEVTYSPVREGVVDIGRTYVSPALRGHGIAARLMESLAAELRKNGLKALASCSYADVWLAKNRAANTDIIAETER